MITVHAHIALPPASVSLGFCTQDGFPHYIPVFCSKNPGCLLGLWSKNQGINPRWAKKKTYFPVTCRRKIHMYNCRYWKCTLHLHIDNPADLPAITELLGNTEGYSHICGAYGKMYDCAIPILYVRCSG